MILITYLVNVATVQFRIDNLANLTFKMFKRNIDHKYEHVPSEASNEPLDSDEQDKIITELREQAIAQAEWAKSVLFYLFLMIAIGFAIMSVATILSPWQISHQSVFKDLLSIEVFEVYYAVSSINTAVLAFAVKVLNYMHKNKHFCCL